MCVESGGGKGLVLWTSWTQKVQVWWYLREGVYEKGVTESPWPLALAASALVPASLLMRRRCGAETRLLGPTAGVWSRGMPQPECMLMPQRAGVEMPECSRVDASALARMHRTLFSPTASTH